MTTCKNCGGYIAAHGQIIGTTLPPCSCNIAKPFLGWECPRCHKIHSPYSLSCDCHIGITSANTTSSTLITTNINHETFMLDTNNITNTNIDTTGKSGDIVFSLNYGKTEMLRLCSNGDIFVKGVLVETDKEVFVGLREFINKGLKENNTKVSVLRDCWSVAYASGHKNFPSLDAMQKDFDEWLKENKI